LATINKDQPTTFSTIIWEQFRLPNTRFKLNKAFDLTAHWLRKHQDNGYMSLRSVVLVLPTTSARDPAVAANLIQVCIGVR
jgi:hypothetical protein